MGRTEVFSMEISYFEVAEANIERFIEEKAKEGRKVCDECRGRGWVHTAEYGDNGEMADWACPWECKHCDGTGWQKCK